MHIIDVGPISNNPQTHYKVVFGRDVSVEKVLKSLQETAEMRERLGLTTGEHTVATIKEAQEKLNAL